MQKNATVWNADRPRCPAQNDTSDLIVEGRPQPFAPRQPGLEPDHPPWRGQLDGGGAGVIHSERTSAASRKAPHSLSGVQTWVTLPEAQEDAQPSFEHHGKESLPLIESDGVSLRLILGRAYGETAPVRVFFTLRGPSLISAEHTEAPASVRGAGAAMALIEHMIGDARASGFKIVPVCPYVCAQYRKHPEWSDVTTTASSP